MATFDLESYSTVQERIAQLYQDFPDASIRTFMVVREGPEVVFEARIYRTPEEAAMGVYTSGFAREIEGKSPVNKTSHLENCESSAIGRALANLGYSTDARRPSRSEMIKVARVRDEHERLIGFVRQYGPNLTNEATVTVSGKEYNLKEFIRKNWTAIKEQYPIARTVVEAMESALEVQFTGSEEDAA